MKLLFLFSSVAISSIVALNAPNLTAPDCFRTVGYWGQNSVGLHFPQADWEKSLDEYCDDSTWDIIVLAFLNIFFEGSPPLPGLNFAFHCTNAPFPAYPNLLQCPDIGSAIQKCQQNGKKIFLSLGGATGNGVFTDDSQAESFAETIWTLLLGGQDTTGMRPFGDAILDGIDLDIEGGSSVGYAAFVNRLRELYATDLTKTYYVSGAPQCPFPDAFLGPSGDTALAQSHFDYVFVQFYNNFCGIQNYPANFNFDQWNTWAQTSKTQVLLGVPGASYSGGGYEPAGTVEQIASDLISKYGPAQNGWFGGVMIWDVGSAETNTANNSNFAADISALLQSKGKCQLPGNSSVAVLPSSNSTLAVIPITTSLSSNSTNTVLEVPVISSSVPDPASPFNLTADVVSGQANNPFNILVSAQTNVTAPTPTASLQPETSASANVMCFCPRENGFPDTPASTIATQPCPGGAGGVIVNFCDNSGGTCIWMTASSFCSF